MNTLDRYDQIASQYNLLLTILNNCTLFFCEWHSRAILHSDKSVFSRFSAANKKQRTCKKTVVGFITFYTNQNTAK